MSALKDKLISLVQQKFSIFEINYANFSSKHRLHLPLKLLAADECLIIFHLICGDP